MPNFPNFNQLLVKFTNILPPFDIRCVYSEKVGGWMRSSPNMCLLHEGWSKTEELTKQVFTPWRLEEDWGAHLTCVYPSFKTLPKFQNFAKFHQHFENSPIFEDSAKFHQNLKNSPSHTPSVGCVVRFWGSGVAIRVCSLRGGNKNKWGDSDEVSEASRKPAGEANLNVK